MNFRNQSSLLFYKAQTPWVESTFYHNQFYRKMLISFTIGQPVPRIYFSTLCTGFDSSFRDEFSTIMFFFYCKAFSLHISTYFSSLNSLFSIAPCSTAVLTGTSELVIFLRASLTSLSRCSAVLAFPKGGSFSTFQVEHTHFRIHKIWKLAVCFMK